MTWMSNDGPISSQYKRASYNSDCTPGPKPPWIRTLARDDVVTAHAMVYSSDVSLMNCGLRTNYPIKTSQSIIIWWLHTRAVLCVWDTCGWYWCLWSVSWWSCWFLCAQVHSKNKWCFEGPYRVLHVVPNTGPYLVLQGIPTEGASMDPLAMVLWSTLRCFRAPHARFLEAPPICCFGTPCPHF